ncbi:pentapeptide repeat-containing protein [Rhodomicrobium lacus]|uniref:pentapeptide repeat-containing protein n=1 Tax=Rhodomicrobium lacus TaxID=2498452 RepID=UPI00349FCE40
MHARAATDIAALGADTHAAGQRNALPRAEKVVAEHALQTDAERIRALEVAPVHGHAELFTGDEIGRLDRQRDGNAVAHVLDAVVQDRVVVIDIRLVGSVGAEDWGTYTLDSVPIKVGTFSHIEVFSVHILGVDFLGVDFNSINFESFNFLGVDFLGLDFHCVDFNSINFESVDFLGVDFLGLDLHCVNFESINFESVDFLGVDFLGLDFDGVDFHGVNFNSINFESANFLGVDFLGGDCLSNLKRAANARVILHSERTSFGVAANLQAAGGFDATAFD